MRWPDFKKGDRVVVARETHKGRHGVCLTDNTETQFGHKHVRIRFDKPDDELPIEDVVRTVMVKKEGEQG